MTHAAPRAIGLKSLALAGTATAAGLAVLVWSSSDRLIDRGFERAFAAGGSTGGGTAPPSERAAATLVEQGGLWLTRGEPHAMPAAQGLARVGERITMAVDGGQPLELEVMAVTELSAALATTDHGPAASRLVMVTAREVAGQDRSGRIVRVIVEADEPMPAATRAAPARAL